MRIQATNAAGLVGTADSPTLKIVIENTTLSPAKVAGIVLAAVIGTGVLVAAMAIYFTRVWCAPCSFLGLDLAVSLQLKQIFQSTNEGCLNFYMNVVQNYKSC